MVSTAVTALLAISLSTVPASSGALPQTPVPIDTSAEDQYDPHVDGDIAAYSHASFSGAQEIRYYRFGSSSPSGVIPGGGGADFLSDVNQGRIVFTRIIPSQRTAIMLFDTSLASPSPVEVNPTPNSNRLGVALGAQSLLYSDLALAPLTSDGIETGEVVVFDLGSQTAQRLTNDLQHDGNPAVSPDGNVLVWEKCLNLFNCAIYQAVRSGASWTVSQVAPQASLNPDTNGTSVVYEATRAGSTTGRDIFIRPVSGGPEVALELAGDQASPSARGNVIAFESGPAYQPADIYLYETTTNRLFQITNTPVHESLNDVTVLPSGQVRLVWNVDTADTTRDVYGATFTLPGIVQPPVCQPQSVTLVAERHQSPTSWVDADVSFPQPLTFTVPSEIPVTAGNSGNKWAWLTLYTSGGCVTTCKYRGGSNRAHPQTPAQLAQAQRYEFEFCTGQGHNLQAGSAVQVDRVKLHVQNGDSHQPVTRVQLTLTSVCGPAPATICGSCDEDEDDEEGEGDHDDDDDLRSGDDVGTVELGLNDPERTPTLGCSSTSGSLAWPALFLGAAVLVLRRRSPIRLLQRQERRRLPR